ncbi:MAG: hypothetical protein ACUVTD_00635 [Nitrososphaerales archaeon]
MKTEEVAKYMLSITPERKIEAEIRFVPLAKLKLDPKNVRFKHFQKELSDEEMQNEIWSDPDTRNLYREIIYSQGLQHPPLVDANCVVKEGNRRVVCLRKLKEDIQSGRFDIPLDKIDPVQCIVLPPDITDIDIAIYLTREHVTGKKEWAALDKASHVYDLYNVHRLSFDQIREAVSMGKATAMTMEVSYKKTLEYHAKYPDDKEWLGRYSYFYELYKKKQLKEWVEKNGNLDQFMAWVHDGKIERGEQVRELTRIIIDPDAYQAFLDGGIRKALDVLSGKDPSLTSSSYKLFSRTLQEIRDFPRSELLDTVRNRSKLQMLKTLHSELGQLIKDIESAGRGS